MAHIEVQYPAPSRLEGGRTAVDPTKEEGAHCVECSSLRNVVRIPSTWLSSERMIGLMTLVGEVEAMNLGVVPGEFNAAKWLGSWLISLLPALGGATPSSYLDTMLGQELVASLIAMAESGAYA